MFKNQKNEIISIFVIYEKFLEYFIVLILSY